MVLPTPVNFTTKEDFFIFTPQTQIFIFTNSPSNLFSEMENFSKSISSKVKMLPFRYYKDMSNLKQKFNFFLIENCRRRSLNFSESVQSKIIGENDEEYEITVTPSYIFCRANTDKGIFNAIQTFKQLIKKENKNIKVQCCEIHDFPFFKYRGILHDVCRGKVPKIETIFLLVDIMALLKLNTLMLHIEHTFKFKKHPLIGKGCSPFSAEDIKKIDSYCREKNIELIPTLQSFGHFSNILKIPKYSPLAESELKWSLCPTDEETYKLLDDMYSEFLPIHTSTLFNACCDETYDLGEGRSKEEAKRIGKGRLYLRHIIRLHELAKRYGKRLMIWGDIILHYPELIKELPKDIIVLNWGYEAEHDFESTQKFKDSGLENFVCPGTSSWNAIFPRIVNSNINIKEFAKAGKKHNSTGLINTDWGDGGHYNLFGFSLYGFAVGAEYSWNPDSKGENFEERFSRVIFGDEKNRIGQIYNQLSEVNELFNHKMKNSSVSIFLFKLDCFKDRIFKNVNFENIKLKILPMLKKVKKEINCLKRDKIKDF